MNKVFADTGYWIALLNPNDELHLKARGVTASLSSNIRFYSFAEKLDFCIVSSKINLGDTSILLTRIKIFIVRIRMFRI
ncbi:MAG: hypothetical protein HCA25_27280 [Dolichospermum sp. DET50]|nr:hypothetical protein [Dolichospermum sp. DET66]MBS3035821.1 hypothetical protein [Dolichospermum sp. DET67]MBS3041024.1 hypothetical protein [Dolichospermum sp. DET50]